MKRWWEKYQAWKVRRKQVALQRWGQERLEGQARFVLRNALLFSMGILTAHEIFGREVGLGTIITYHCIGLFAGFYKWADNETQFHLASTQARVNAAPSGVLPEKPPLGLNSQ